MHLSFPRILQWLGVAAFLFVLVGLTYDFESEAGKTVNAPVEDSLSQSLLGYWKMDEGTGTSTTADASGNGNTLTMTNLESEDWVAGNIGAFSLDFDGTNEYLTNASPSSVLDFTDGMSFTLTGWFNRSRAFDADHTILSSKSAQTTSDGYIIWIDNNGGTDYLNFRADENGSTDTRSVISTTDFSSAGWHHFAVSWQEGSDVTLYIDGAANGAASGTAFASMGTLANDNPFTIGAETDGGLPFNGQLDDIRVYGYALSANEVSRLYQTTVPGSPVDTGLVGHWTFDGNDVTWGDSSSEIKDVSGKGNHGDAAGSLATTSVTPGKLGQGLSFDGSSDSINAGSGDSLDDITNLSVCAWINPRTSGSIYGGHNHGTIAMKNINSGSTGWFFDINDYLGATRLYFKKVFSSIDGWWFAPVGAVPLNVWSHVCVTYNRSSTANNPTFYVNSTSVTVTKESTPNGDALSEASGNFSIGAIFDGGTTAFFDGKIDGVRVYNRILSATEILNLYNRGK